VALLVLVLGGCDAPGVSGACSYEAPWCSRGRVAAEMPNVVSPLAPMSGDTVAGAGLPLPGDTVASEGSP
jgi:hypothetical protein